MECSHINKKRENGMAVFLALVSTKGRLARNGALFQICVTLEFWLSQSVAVTHEYVCNV